MVDILDRALLMLMMQDDVDGGDDEEISSCSPSMIGIDELWQK